MNPYITQIARLEQELELWRQRAEALEAALGISGDWYRAVAPLSLQQTRIMRLVAHRDQTLKDLHLALEYDYPDASEASIKVRLCEIRQMMPAGLMPSKLGGRGHPYTVRDRAALREALTAGLLPARWAA